MIGSPPPLPCPTAAQLILLQTVRPGEFEQFGAEGVGDGGSGRTTHSPESVPSKPRRSTD